jgi:hypothetical protein
MAGVGKALFGAVGGIAAAFALLPAGAAARPSPLIICPLQPAKPATAARTGKGPLLLAADFGPFKVRPKELSFGSEAKVVGIAWSSWNRHGAQGSGAYTPYFGPPGCNRLPTVLVRAKLRAYRPVGGRFTRLQLTLTPGGGGSAGHTAVLVLARKPGRLGAARYYWRCAGVTPSPILGCLGPYPYLPAGAARGPQPGRDP